MRMIKVWQKLLTRRSDENSGFTFIELMVVVLILGIITAISVPAYHNQQRSAIEATVKSDVQSNKTPMSSRNAGRLYVTEQQFMETSVSSGKNKRGYTVNNSGVVACEWASYEFTADDIIVYHFLSSEGYMKTGPCPVLADPTVNKPGGGTVWIPGEEKHDGNPEVNPDLTQMAGIVFKKTYSPQTNSLNFCYTVNMAIDPTYPHATKPPTYKWEYKIDVSKPPFWGLNPNLNLHSMYGYKTKNIVGSIWTIQGEGWNDMVTESNPRTIGFCTSFVPEPPLNSDTYSYTVVASTVNTNWWACVDFKVTSELEYPTPWEVTIDLDKYFQNITGKTPQFINLNGERVSGNTYKATGIGWNKYVSNTMQRTYSTSICYYPNGSKW